MTTKMYNLFAVNNKTDKKTIMTSSPVTHKEAMTMKSKLTAHPSRRLAIAEVKDTKPRAKKVLPKTSLYKKNPAAFPATKKATRELHQAMELYRNFSGHEPEVVGKVKKPIVPDTGIVIGELEGVAYETVRDNVTEKYFHKFDKKSRPLLCSSFDGRQIFIIEGKYNFTEDGIVDRK